MDGTHPTHDGHDGPEWVKIVFRAHCTRCVGKTWVRGCRQVCIWIITQFKKMLQNLMLYVVKLDPHNLSWTKIWPLVIWNLVQPRARLAVKLSVPKGKNLIWIQQVLLHVRGKSSFWHSQIFGFWFVKPLHRWPSLKVKHACWLMLLLLLRKK